VTFCACAAAAATSEVSATSVRKPRFVMGLPEE
jgi:hypothetical protein